MNETDDFLDAVDEDELDAELAHQDRLSAYRSWTRFFAVVAAVVVAGVVALLVIVAGGGGNSAACEAAVRALVPSAMAGVDHSETKPRACEGLPDAELERIATAVMGDMMTKAFSGLADSFGETPGS